MEKYFTKPTEGFHFSEKGLKTVQDHYGGTYVGYFCTKRPDGSWNETPVDVFYQPNPDRSKGHTNYFGMYRSHDDHAMITNAESAFSEPITGVLTDDGEVIVSRYRHDYVTKGNKMVDGGRDYLRRSAGDLVKVTIVGDEFQFEVMG